MATERKHILVTIDSNDQAVVALKQSYDLARLTNSKIVLLSVDDGTAKNIEGRLKELAEEASSKTGQPVETIIRKGDIYEEINKVADEIHPLFIVLGVARVEGENIRGRNKNALQMIRKSQHPIITVGGKTHIEGCKTILMPLDLTMQSREKVPKAVEFAKLFNAHIQILCVLTDETKLEENKLHMYANQCIKFMKENEVRAAAKFIRTKDDMVVALFDYGKKINADMIIVVTSNDVSIKEYFKGTPAQRLVNTSDIPVLTLRPLERRDTSQAIF